MELWTRIIMIRNENWGVWGGRSRDDGVILGMKKGQKRGRGLMFNGCCGLET
jgi:hypothetical protein